MKKLRSAFFVMNFVLWVLCAWGINSNKTTSTVKVLDIETKVRGTSGFWGIVKKGKEKMIFSQFDSYPEGLGKDVVFLIQNNLESLDNIFDRIIIVNNIDDLDEDNEKCLLVSPDSLISDDIYDRFR
jgi:hypothetical protein